MWKHLRGKKGQISFGDECNVPLRACLPFQTEPWQIKGVDLTLVEASHASVLCLGHQSELCETEGKCF